MDERHYVYEKLSPEVKYDFWSVSAEKRVKKRVIFTPADFPNLYNVALLDVFDDEVVSDNTETRNKDMTTVLATVIKIIDEFLKEYPNKMVAFRGNDERRQRLYRLLVAK